MLVDVDPVMVILRFDSGRPDELEAVLARYVVLSRGHPGCQNIDLVASVVHPGRLVVVEKWASAEAQRAHFDSADMVAMARACEGGLLTSPPEIDLYDGISMHDLA